MLYLKARFYAPETGRFITRDTWDGNAHQPITYNFWNYAEANPVNYTDPTGHCSWTENNRINNAERNVLPQANDPMATYVAAGIAVQCWGVPADLWGITPGLYNGSGISQTSVAMTQIAYGKPIEDPGYIFLGLRLRKPSIRGYGERCYIPLVSTDPCICLTPKEIARIPDFYNQYQLEPPHELSDPVWSVEYMRRRIQMSLNECKENICNSDRDQFIIAALAQNGPGFTMANIRDLRIHVKEHRIQWKDWYDGLSVASKKEYRDQWRLFYKFARRLNNDGYYLPPNILNDDMILWLKDQ